MFRPTVPVPYTKIDENTYRFGHLTVKVTANEPSKKAIQDFNEGYNVLADEWIKTSLTKAS